MKVGDIVQWTPSYARNKYMSEWIGIILDIKDTTDKIQVQVYWFKNKEKYYTADWTPASQLKKISNS